VSSEFRWVALVAGIGSAVLALVVSWLVATLLLVVQRDRAVAEAPLVSPWILGFLILFSSALVIAVTWYAVRRLAERRAVRTGRAMRQVTQRAEEYGAGGFALEPLTSEELVPLTSGVEELDSLSRVLERNHHALMRALTAERSFAADASHQLRTPLAALLLRRNATVTLAHSRTTDLGAGTRRADILVVAAGSPRLVTPPMVKPGAAVLDVGLTRVDGRIVGDVDPAVASVAGWLTPMPGGTGPMTVVMVIVNTLTAARRRRAA